MSAPVRDAEIKSARLVTEAEWKRLRLDAMAAGPAMAGAEGGIPAVLIPYQQKLLATTAANAVTVVEKSRRTGVTWAAGADAVLTSASAKSAGGMDTLYIGYNLDMAREFIDVCAMWARSFEMGLAVAGVEDFLFDDGPDRNIAAFRIKFASGFEITALASRPRSLRGRQGYVIIDEAAFHDDLPGVLQAAMALLIWGGKVLIISTHNGEENPYNRLVKDIRGKLKPYALLRIDFDDALHDGLYQRICLVTGKTWSVDAEAEWRGSIISFYGEGADEELFCIPREGSGAFLPAPLIEARAREGIPVLRLTRPADFTFWAQHLRDADIDAWCEAELRPLLEQLDPELTHFLGGDYGRVSDLTVLWPLARTKMNRLVTPFVVEMRSLPFDAQERVQTYILTRLPRLLASNHDATGLGASLAEKAAQQVGPSIAEQTKLSVEWYRENMQPMKTAFETDAIEIPDDHDIKSDLKIIVTKAGVAHVPALKSGVNKDRHGDAAVALALAVYAAHRKVAHIDYTPVDGGGQARGSEPYDEDDNDAGAFRRPVGTRLNTGGVPW